MDKAQFEQLLFHEYLFMMDTLAGGSFCTGKRQRYFRLSCAQQGGTV